MARKTGKTHPHSHSTDSSTLHKDTGSGWAVVDDDVASSAVTSLNDASWKAYWASSCTSARVWRKDDPWVDGSLSMCAATDVDIDVAAAVGTSERHWTVRWGAGDAVLWRMRSAAGSWWNKAMNNRAVDGRWDLRLVVHFLLIDGHLRDQGEVDVVGSRLSRSKVLINQGRQTWFMCKDR